MPLRLRVIPSDRSRAPATDASSDHRAHRRVRGRRRRDPHRPARRRRAEPAVHGAVGGARAPACASGPAPVDAATQLVASKTSTARTAPSSAATGSHHGEQRLMLAGDEVDLAHVRLVFDGHSQASSGAEGTGDDRAPAGQRSVPGSPGANAPDADGGRRGRRTSARSSWSIATGRTSSGDRRPATCASRWTSSPASTPRSRAARTGSWSATWSRRTASRSTASG